VSKIQSFYFNVPKKLNGQFTLWAEHPFIWKLFEKFIFMRGGPDSILIFFNKDNILMQEMV
jgi:hypothetical protein